MKKKNYGLQGFIALCALMGLAQMSSAQVGVGITTPDPSAQLQIESTDKGLLIPRVATTSAVNTPATGLMVYQTGGIPGFYYNSGTPISPEWVKIATGSTGLADSSVTNAKVAPDAAIAYSKLNLNGSIQNGDLTANAVTTSKVANGTVTTFKMADSAVSNVKIATNAINNAHIADGTLNPAKLSTTGATSGQVLGYNGSSIGWTTPASGGSQPYSFSAQLPSTIVNASSDLTDWNTYDPYYSYSGFNSGTGVFTVPVTGNYALSATINYKTTAAVTVSMGGGVDPYFEIARTAPATTSLVKGYLPILDVNVALVLTLRTILGSAAVPLNTVVRLNAGDVIQLRYNADGLTIPITLGGDSLDAGVVWSVVKLDDNVPD